MPVAPRKPCKHPMCRELVSKGAYCGQHLKVKEENVRVERVKYDKERGTSASRGYTHRWNKYSKMFRKENPLCVMCEKEGKLKLADCVDHVIAVDGSNDPLFWEPTNHQSLCNICHNVKSEAEGNRYNQKDRFL